MKSTSLSDKSQFVSGITKNIIFQDDSSELVLHNSSDLDLDQFVNWSKNRPVDLVRVQQIKEYYLNNNISLVPGIISCWVSQKPNRIGAYAVYDGIHRLWALREVIATGQNMNILIQYKKTKKEQEIIDDFVNINKSVCIPSIYIEDTDVLKKTVCQNIAEELCKKYPSFVSPSRKPFIYNFNRDIVIEFISTWNINFSKPGIQELAIQELLKINREAKEYVNKMNIEHPKKCKYHDFFLFYLEKSEIKRRIEAVLQ